MGEPKACAQTSVTTTIDSSSSVVSPVRHFGLVIMYSLSPCRGSFKASKEPPDMSKSVWQELHHCFDEERNALSIAWSFLTMPHDSLQVNRPIKLILWMCKGVIDFHSSGKVLRWVGVVLDYFSIFYIDSILYLVAYLGPLSLYFVRAHHPAM